MGSDSIVTLPIESPTVASEVFSVCAVSLTSTVVWLACTDSMKSTVAG